MKEARVIWTEGMQFVGAADSNHAMVLDAAPEVGGTNSGVRPGELLLIALGGCTGMDVVSVLNKMRVKFDSFHIKLSAESATEHPRVYTRIELTYVISGKDIPPDKVERAIELSWSKYCSVGAMLEKTAKISYHYEIKKPEEQP